MTLDDFERQSTN